MITQILTHSSYSFVQLVFLLGFSCQSAITWGGHWYFGIGTGIGKQVYTVSKEEKQHFLEYIVIKEIEQLEAEMERLETQIAEVNTLEYLRVLAEDDLSEDLDKLITQSKQRDKKYHREDEDEDEDKYNLLTPAREALNIIRAQYKSLMHEKHEDQQAQSLKQARRFYKTELYIKRAQFLQEYEYLSYLSTHSAINPLPLHVKIAYHFNYFVDCAVELNYLHFSSLMKLLPPQYHNYPNTNTAPILKETVLDGLYLLGKAKIPILWGVKCYPQLGIGGFWGKTSHNDEYQPDFLPISFSIATILGAGIEYPLSKKLILDCSWDYGIIYNVNRFHLFKINLSYHIF